MDKRIILVFLIFLSPNITYVFAQSVEDHLSSGQKYYKRGQYDKALAYLEKAIELNPNNPETYVALGSTYRFLGEFEQAIVQYKKALEIDPYCVYAYRDLGYTYGLLGEEEKERQHLEIAKELFLRQGDYQNAKGIEEHFKYLEFEKYLDQR